MEWNKSIKSKRRQPDGAAGGMYPYYTPAGQESQGQAGGFGQFLHMGALSPCTVNDTGHPHAVPGPRPKHRCAAGSPGIAAALRLFGGFPGALALIRCARLPPAGGPGGAEM